MRFVRKRNGGWCKPWHGESDVAPEPERRTYFISRPLPYGCVKAFNEWHPHGCNLSGTAGFMLVSRIAFGTGIYFCEV